MVDEPIDLRPYLICLNLQQVYVAHASAREMFSAVLWRIRTCLDWARDKNMPVVHVHTADAAGRCSPPIPGFEPLPREAILKKGALETDTAPEWCRSAAARGRRFVLTGLVFTCDTLAAKLGDIDCDLRIVVVRDALGATAMEAALSNAAIENMLRTASPNVAALTTQSLIERFGSRFGF